MKTISQILLAGLVAASFAMSGCIVIHSSTISSSTGKGGTPVAGDHADWGILHLTAPEDMSENVNQQLLSGCPSGRISRVSTEFTVREFILAQMYDLSALGYCAPAGNP